MSKMSDIIESSLKHKDYKEQTSDKNVALESMEERSFEEDEHMNSLKCFIAPKLRLKRCSDAK